MQAIVDGLVDGLVGEAVDGLCGRVRGHRRRLFSRGAQDSDPAGWDYSPAGSPPEGRRCSEDQSPPDTKAPRQEPHLEDPGLSQRERLVRVHRSGYRRPNLNI